MSSGALGAGTSLATGLPCLVIRTGSPVFWTLSITARQRALNSPAGICFTGLTSESSYHDYGHINMTITVIPTPSQFRGSGVTQSERWLLGGGGNLVQDHRCLACVLDSKKHDGRIAG